MNNTVLIVVDTNSEVKDATHLTALNAEVVKPLMESFGKNVIITQDKSGKKLLSNVSTDENIITFDKESYGTFGLVNYMKTKYVLRKVSSVEIIGGYLETDIMTIALMLQAEMPALHIIVDMHACVAISSEGKMAAIKILNSCGIEVR